MTELETGGGPSWGVPQRVSHPKVEVEGRFSTRLLVESGWKLSKGKENRLEAKLSHHYQDRTSKRRETDGVSQPQRTARIWPKPSPSPPVARSKPISNCSPFLRSTKFSTGSSTAMCRRAWSSTSRGANNDEPVCMSHSAFSRRILTVGNQVGAVWTVISLFGAKGSGRIEPNQARTIVGF